MAYADTPEDAVISIQSIHVYQGLSTDNDTSFIFHWRWESDNTSATPASSTVLIELSYNGTVVASATPYVFSLFENNGYGDGMTGFYLTANQSHWMSTLYTITIKGLPAYYSPPPYFDYSIQAADYVDLPEQIDNQISLRTYILAEIDIFKTIYPDVTLKSISDVGTVLSTYGEAYFSSAIPGLQNLCPQLFFVQNYIPSKITLQDYDTTLADEYSLRLAGTDLERGANRLGDYIGVSGAVIWALLMFIGEMALLIWCMKKGWEIQVGLAIDGFVTAGAAVLIGDLIFTIAMIIGFIAVLGLSFAVVGKRA